MKKFLLLFSLISLYAFSNIRLTEPSFTNFQSKNIPICMELNFWNIESYEGNAYLEFNPELNSVEFFANLSNIKQKNASGWVLGYPEVFYGFKPWLSNGQSTKIWELPEKVKALKDVVFSFKYELWYKDNLPINLAMETWITREKYPSMVKEGEVEIMVWLYYNQLRPAGYKTGEITIPIIVDGKKVEMIWEVYYAKMTWDYIAFLPVKPIEKGVLEIPIKPFVSKTREVISSHSERIKANNFDDMYFEVWEVGTEFGSPTTTNANFGYKFSDFNIKKR